MPLLGRKIHKRISSPTIKDGNNEVYVIDHTQEHFLSKDEYEQRLAVYNQRVWTCQCSGHTNLTLEEAMKSEKENYELLKSRFQKYFEKPVLALVHHSSIVLDSLVDEAWVALQQQFMIDEPVQLKVKAHGESVIGKIAKVTETEEKGLETNKCNSPSSDKENHEASQTNDGVDGTPKKWVPPKLLPYHYSILLEGEEKKLISGIPACDIQRIHRTPSKDLVKLFIRSFAIRQGPKQNGPWVVQESLVKEYSIPNKLPDFFIQPPKAIDYKEEYELTKKRHLSDSPKGAPAMKRTKLENGSQKSSPAGSEQNTPKKRGRPPKNDSVNSSAKQQKGRPRKSNTELNSPKKTTQKKKVPSDNEVVVLESDSSHDNGSPSKVLKEAKRQLEDRIKATNSKTDSNTPKKRGPKPKSGNVSKSSSTVGTPTPGTPGTPSQDSPKKRGRPKKEPGAPKGPYVKKSKQITLFDMNVKKNSSKGTPKSSPTKNPKSPSKKTPTFRLPPLAVKLRKAIKLQKDGASSKQKLNLILLRCAKELNAKTVAKLPDDLRELVQEKSDKLKEKKKIEKMSPEDREAYLKKKRKDAIVKAQKEKLQLNKRYEDTDLELKPLPTPKLVSTSDGMANELFGDITMVTEFINCYRKLLMPEDEERVYPEGLMKALVAGEAGFGYISRILTILLQTLLQDQIAVGYQELSMTLSKLSVTPQSSPEYLRLCMRYRHGNDTGEEEDEDIQGEIPDKLLEELEETDFFKLSIVDKLTILNGLCQRVLSTYAVQDFMLEMQEEAQKVTRERNERKKDEKVWREENKSILQALDGVESQNKEEEEKSEGLTITSFYSKDEDLASVVKGRQMKAAKAAAERREREYITRHRRDREMEVVKKIQDQERFHKEFANIKQMSQEIIRQTPLGTDRNHDRYWLLQTATPGIYVEKGWAPTCMTYCVNKQGKCIDQRKGIYDTDTDLEIEPELDGRMKKVPKELIEKTFPHQGQNLWFIYDNVKDVEQLVEHLHPNGVREADLKQTLEKRLVNYKFKSMSDGYSELNGEDAILEESKSELIAIALRLYNGALGGVKNIDEWEKQVNKLSTLDELSEKLMQVYEAVQDKYLTGLLEPKTIKRVTSQTKLNSEQNNAEDVCETVRKHQKAEQWIDAVNNCQTFSRFHFLLGIFENSIKWEKSTENLKCKVCRKNDEYEMLICDSCNGGYHLHCLRPIVTEVPEGEWLCAACKPREARQATRNKNYRTLAGESDDEVEEIEESSILRTMKKEENCTMCGGDENLVLCSTCPSAFHLECHQPPLYRMPRSVWRCNQCVTGVRLKKPKSGSRRGQRVNYHVMNGNKSDSSDESSEESDEEYEDFDSSMENHTNSKSSRARRPTNRVSRASYAEAGSSSSEDNDDYESSPYVILRDSAKASPGDHNQEDDHSTMEKKNKKDLAAVKVIIQRLVKNRHSWPFVEPVDIDEVPDYYEIVKNPTSLESMRSNVLEDKYPTAQEFVDEMALLFDNAELYNKADSEVGQCVAPLEAMFRELRCRYLPRYVYRRDFANPAIFNDHVYTTNIK